MCVRACVLVCVCVCVFAYVLETMDQFSLHVSEKNGVPTGEISAAGGEEAASA